MNLQDSFLNQVRKDSTEIQLVLLDGTRLSGFVRGFDNFTVIMSSHGSQHLIYKHAIAQIVSRRPAHGDFEREHHEEGQPTGIEGAAEEQAQEAEPQQPHHPRPEEHQQRRERPQRRENYQRREEHHPRREEGHGREEHPRHENHQRREEQQHKDKFNSIDLSSLRIDQNK